MAGRYSNGGSPGTLQLRFAVGRQVRLMRQRRGWSQEVLAELADMHRSYVGAVERGEHNIGIDNVERLALALEITICRLIGCADLGAPASPTEQGVPP